MTISMTADYAVGLLATSEAADIADRSTVAPADRFEGIAAAAADAATAPRRAARCAETKADDGPL